MTNWEEAVNLMKINGKKRKIREHDKLEVGLRCWECGLYLDNLGTGHYCSKCLIKKLKKYMNISSGTSEQTDDYEDSNHSDDTKDSSSETEEDNDDEN